MKNFPIVIAFILLAFSINIQAQESDAGSQDIEWQQCLERLQDQAKASGISENTIDTIIPGLEFLPDVIKYDRSQPEFTQSFANYLDRRVSKQRIKQGKLKLQEHQHFLQQLFKTYGIPGRYLIAFWGLETNFGSYLGKMPTLDSLATLACDKRRSAFFSEELMLALKLIDRESIRPEQMHGSWAGAMGHTQFMPSTYFKYAVDGDGDGKINLWQSEKDALSSAANYLRQMGWHSGERWGREVLLPESFPFEQSHFKNWKPLNEWRSLDVKTVYAKKLPALEMPASILIPAGHKGPAFLVYQNFKIIMRWNQSKHYALAVGLLADRISGMPPLKKQPEDTGPFSREKIALLQNALNAKGFNAGKADGIMGSNTQEALQKYQLSRGLIADGYPDSNTQALLLKKEDELIE
jgi:membrane-bound lytic murein transglycosylase B